MGTLLTAMTAALALVSCATPGGWFTDWQAVDPAALPGDVAGRFAACDGEGVVRMTVSSDGKTIGSPSAEWMSEGPDKFLMDLFDPSGLTLLEVSFLGGDRLSLRGGGAVKEALALKEEFLFFDGTSLKLKAKEVPCLLAYRFPLAWMSAMLSAPDGRTFLVKEKEREILLTFPGGAAAGACAEIADSKLLGLYRLDRKVCFRPGAGGLLEVRNLGFIEWSDADAE